MRNRLVGAANGNIRTVGPRQPRFRVGEPFVRKSLPLIGIACPGRIQLDGLSFDGFYLDRRSACVAVHHHAWVMVRMGKIFDRPIHPRRKVVLESVSPAPDARLVGDMRPAINSDNRILRSHAIEFIPAL